MLNSEETARKQVDMALNYLESARKCVHSAMIQLSPIIGVMRAREYVSKVEMGLVEAYDLLEDDGLKQGVDLDSNAKRKLASGG
jgi:hypothetical protein